MTDLLLLEAHFIPVNDIVTIITAENVMSIERRYRALPTVFSQQSSKKVYFDANLKLDSAPLIDGQIYLY
jgi:hypothetical protein